MATLSHGQHLQRFQRVRIEKKIQKTDICDAGIVVSPSLEGGVITTFLNESPVCRSEKVACSRFSAVGMEYAD